MNDPDDDLSRVMREHLAWLNAETHRHARLARRWSIVTVVWCALFGPLALWMFLEPGRPWWSRLVQGRAVVVHAFLLALQVSNWRRGDHDKPSAVSGP